MAIPLSRSGCAMASMTASSGTYLDLKCGLTLALTAGAKADCALIRAGISAAMDSLLSTVNLRIKIPIRQRATGCGGFVLAVGVETCAHLVCGRHATVAGHGGLAQVEVAIRTQQLVRAVCVLGKAVGLRVNAHDSSSIGTGLSGIGL